MRVVKLLLFHKVFSDNGLCQSYDVADSPGSTSCFWGCIRGPTPPLGGAQEDSYWQGFRCCCFLENSPCSILCLSLWGTDIKTTGAFQFSPNGRIFSDLDEHQFKKATQREQQNTHTQSNTDENTHLCSD